MILIDGSKAPLVQFLRDRDGERRHVGGAYVLLSRACTRKPSSTSIYPRNHAEVGRRSDGVFLIPNVGGAYVPTFDWSPQQIAERGLLEDLHEGVPRRASEAPHAPVPLYPSPTSPTSKRRARDEQTSAEATVWTVGREQYPHWLLRASEGRGLDPVASASAAFALVSGLWVGAVHKSVHKAVEIGPKSALSAVTSSTDIVAEEVAR